MLPPEFFLFTLVGVTAILAIAGVFLLFDAVRRLVRPPAAVVRNFPQKSDRTATKAVKPVERAA